MSERFFGALAQGGNMSIDMKAWGDQSYNVTGYITKLLSDVQGGFLTGPPDFQYQNEKTCSANEELFYIENFMKN